MSSVIEPLGEVLHFGAPPSQKKKRKKKNSNSNSNSNSISTNNNKNIEIEKKNEIPQLSLDQCPEEHLIGM